MATLYADCIWEGLAVEMVPDLAGSRNGHFYKQLDTGESYHRRNGAWYYVNLGFAFIKATKSGRAMTDASGHAEIVFNTPFINDEYSVALTCLDRGKVQAVIGNTYARTPAGFKIVTRRTNGNEVGGVEVSWLCTRDYNP